MSITPPHHPHAGAVAITADPRTGDSLALKATNISDQASVQPEASRVAVGLPASTGGSPAGVGSAGRGDAISGVDPVHVQHQPRTQSQTHRPFPSTSPLLLPLQPSPQTSPLLRPCPDLVQHQRSMQQQLPPQHLSVPLHRQPDGAKLHPHAQAAAVALDPTAMHPVTSAGAAPVCPRQPAPSTAGSPDLRSSLPAEQELRLPTPAAAFAPSPTMGPTMGSMLRPRSRSPNSPKLLPAMMLQQPDGGIQSKTRPRNSSGGEPMAALAPSPQPSSHTSSPEWHSDRTPSPLIGGDCCHMLWSQL